MEMTFIVTEKTILLKYLKTRMNTNLKILFGSSK